MHHIPILVDISVVANANRHTTPMNGKPHYKAHHAHGNGGEYTNHLNDKLHPKSVNIFTI